MVLKMAVPNKGRLNERTVELLQKSGLDLGEDWGRRLYIKVRDKDIEVVFVRAQDIPVFVRSGAVDMGITGQDQVADADVELTEMLLLGFGHCRLSVAVPEKSEVRAAEDIPDGSRIATSFAGAAGRYFASIGKKVEIVNVTGAAEIMPYMGVSDYIVDLVSSGSTLKTNRLREVATILTSQAVAVGNPESLKVKGEEMWDIIHAMKSVIDAESKKYLMADVPADRMDDIEKLFPGMAGPTVMNIAGRDDMVAIHVVIDASDVYDDINRLKKLGAKGILTLPIDRLVP